MKTFWQKTSSGIGLLFVARGVLLANRDSDLGDIDSLRSRLAR